MAWISLLCKDEQIPSRPGPQHSASEFSSLLTSVWKEVMLGPSNLSAKCGDLNITVFLFQPPASPENGGELCQLQELVSSAASRAKTEYRQSPALPLCHIRRGTNSRALTRHTKSPWHCRQMSKRDKDSSSARTHCSENCCRERQTEHCAISTPGRCDHSEW